MKKFRINHYKGNLLESLNKFSKNHKNIKIVEAVEEDNVLKITADLESDVSTKMENPENNDYFQSVFLFGTKLLMFGTEVHLWHLNCKRHFEHIVLQDLYETCDDIGDKLLEAAIGITGRPVSVSDVQNQNFSNVNVNYDGQTSIDKIIQIKNEACALANGTSCGIDNIIGGFCETCDSVIYKLKQFAD